MLQTVILSYSGNDLTQAKHRCELKFLLLLFPPISWLMQHNMYSRLFYKCVLLWDILSHLWVFICVKMEKKYMYIWIQSVNSLKLDNLKFSLRTISVEEYYLSLNLTWQGYESKIKLITIKYIFSFLDLMWLPDFFIKLTLIISREITVCGGNRKLHKPGMKSLRWEEFFQMLWHN